MATTAKKAKSVLTAEQTKCLLERVKSIRIMDWDRPQLKASAAVRKAEQLLAAFRERQTKLSAERHEAADGYVKAARTGLLFAKSADEALAIVVAAEADAQKAIVAIEKKYGVR